MKRLIIRRIKISFRLLLTTIAVLTASCDQIYDNIEEYVDGEIVYIDKFDGIIKVQVGYERAEIDLLNAGRIPASQIRMAKATKTVIECEDFTEPGNRRVIDSICSWVNITGLKKLKNYEFTIYTEDEYGNRSIPLKTEVKPFTEENLNSLEFTPPMIIASPTAAVMEWVDGISVNLFRVYRHVWQYTDKDGILRSKEEVGDKPVIFVENVLSEVDIPITMKCRVVPTLSNFDGTYTPIIDTVDFQKSFSIRLVSNAEEVIFLKTPTPSINTDLTDTGTLPLTFSWIQSDAAKEYTLKFSLSPNFPAETTYSVDVGSVSEYEMYEEDLFNLANSLPTEAYMINVYWSVAPTESTVPVKTQFRLLTLWKLGIFYQVDRSVWTIADVSDYASDSPPRNVYDGRMGTIWHTAWNPVAPPFPHWIIIDMQNPTNVFKYDVVRRTDPNYGDTKTVELFLGNSVDYENGTWTLIGSVEFYTPNGGLQSRIEALATDNVTKGRYLLVNCPDGYRNTINIDEIVIYSKE